LKSSRSVASRRAARPPARKKTPARKKKQARPPRLRLQIDQRRAQLLELGIKLFSTRSYNSLSIDDVAAAAGISKGLLYHYFPGKQEFYVEVIREASHRLQRLTAPDPTLSPSARLRAAVDAHLNYVQEYGPVYAAIYESGVAIAPEVSAILEEHRRVVLQYFLHDFRITRPRPVLRSALRAWISMVEGASLDWISHPELDRNHLRDLLIAGYAAMLGKAIELDPKLAVSLEKVLRSGQPHSA
jgi:AcrR family transcriptional regulator